MVEKKKKKRPAKTPSVDASAVASPAPEVRAQQRSYCSGSQDCRWVPSLVFLLLVVGALLAYQVTLGQRHLKRAETDLSTCVARSNQLDAQVQAEQMKCKNYKDLYDECVSPIGEARR